jgi:hypothetical protein
MVVTRAAVHGAQLPLRLRPADGPSCPEAVVGIGPGTGSGNGQRTTAVQGGRDAKGISNIELGRRLGISTNAAWRLQHKLMQAMLELDRRYKLGAAGHRLGHQRRIVDARDRASGCVGAHVVILHIDRVEGTEITVLSFI